MRFLFDESVYRLGVRGAYFDIRGMQNRPSEDLDVKAFVSGQLALIPRDLDKSPDLRGFAELHAAVSPRLRKLSASPENLLTFFRTRGDIPRVNGIVDVYNAVSVASGLAVGAHDLAYVVGDIELRLTRGDEPFWPLGAAEPARIRAGEYAYIDNANELLCRLEVRQVEKTKIRQETRDAFFIVQGHHGIDDAFIERTAVRLAEECRRLFGGEIEALHPQRLFAK
jgi:DNA/RNA-binding domain of Phe-tRNA-synthetase-like protein